MVFTVKILLIPFVPETALPYYYPTIHARIDIFTPSLKASLDGSKGRAGGGGGGGRNFLVASEGSGRSFFASARKSVRHKIGKAIFSKRL